MPFEVQTAGKPAVPHRALVFGVVLLALTCALAGNMVRSGSRKALGLRVAPPGWAISFQPPRGFQPGRETIDAGAMSVRGFVGATRGGAMVTLTVRHLRIVSQVDSETVARLVAGKFAAGPLVDSKYPRPGQQVARIGMLEAVEILNRQIATVVRAVVLPDSRALALSLSVQGASLDTQIYRLFDLTCRSVVYE